MLGPKEFPVALKKIGSYFGKLKNTLSNFQKEVNSVTDNIDVEKDLNNYKENKNTNKGKMNLFFIKLCNTIF